MTELQQQEAKNQESKPEIDDLLHSIDELIRYTNNYEMEYEIASLSMDDMMNLMQTESNNMVIIDQRTSSKHGDWFGGHIKGAINIPSYKFQQEISKIYEKYKDKKYVIIHCMYSQFRGPKATKLYSQYLQEKQPKSKQYVYLLEGGFNNWLNQCIKRNKMDLIQEYDASKWELINDEYSHINEHEKAWDEIDIFSRIPAPKITTFKWGIVDIDYNGKIETFKDVILTPNSASSWNWKLDGTRHKPGITIAAIENNKLCDNADIVILTKGVHLVLKTKQETKQYLERAKQNGKIKEYMILQSNEAVSQYTKLVQNGKKVSGLFHSTC